MTLDPGMRNDPRRRRLLTFWSGGWVLLLALVITALLLARTLHEAIVAQHRVVGDGRHIDTYGYRLDNLNVPRDALVAAGLPKDCIPTMTEPGTITPAEAQASRLLKAHDRVIGVMINGDARAYPLSVLNWHEIVNDTLGGEPILVTYSPLTDSVVVLERRVADEVREFRSSGLLLDSNMVMYDRHDEPARESLWSQLLCRAIAGPAADASQALTRIPAELTAWSLWYETHPGTLVLRPEVDRKRFYKRQPYISYFGSDELRFPVKPLPPADTLHYKARVVVVTADGHQAVYPLEALEAVGRDPVTIQQGNASLRFDPDHDSATCRVTTADGEPADVIYSFWFAWYATHPDAIIWSSTQSASTSADTSASRY